MKPPISYYGGKIRLAEWIVSLFPPHRVYLEPFMATTTVDKIRRFAAAAERLRRVSVDNTDARRFLQRYDAPDAVVYTDPPYLAATRARARDYAHEFSADADHVDLAEVLHGLDATVFLSGYASELYEDLYADWYRTERLIHCVAANHGTGSRHRLEVLWSNRPIAEGRLPFAAVEELA